MTRLPRRDPSIAVLVLLFSIAGCAAPAGEDVASGASSVVDSSAELDAIVSAGTKVQSESTPGNADHSAVTTLQGWIPGGNSARIADTIADVRRWTEISRDTGKRLVSKVEHPADDHGPLDVGRNASARVQFQDGDTKVELDLALHFVMGGHDGEHLLVTVTNTNTFKAGPFNAFTVIKPGGYRMSLELTPYRGGLVVEGRTTAKLEKAEDKALSFTADSQWVFEWLKRSEAR